MKTVKLLGSMLLLMTIVYSQVLLKGHGDARLSPRFLNYQGYLTDDQGIPITDPSVSMTFTIYDALSSGNQKWTETQNSVDVSKGVFNVLLGSVTPIPDTVFTAGSDRWLELTVEAQTLSPRTRIVSSAYAYTSTYSDTADYAINALTDNDWIRGTPDSILYTANRLGISRGGANNMAYGTERYTHINFGVNCTTGVDTANYFYATVSGGLHNQALNNYTVVCGGTNNSAAGGASFVGSGWNNHAGAPRAVVGGGHADTSYSFYGFIGSGYGNMAGNDEGDSAAVICGGYDNTVTIDYAAVTGGYANTVVTPYGFIGAGYSNTNGNDDNDTASVVTGGYGNTVNGKFGFIGGGRSNDIGSNYSVIGGGYNNTTVNNRTVIAGGSDNTATGDYSSVLGGSLNHASGGYSTVGGGRENFAGGGYSSIIGGYADTITAAGSYSYLFGINSNLTQDSTFMVDMPHVWFGTEANGYHFPRLRGTNGQVLVTDGSGQLSWSSVAGDADWIISANNMYAGVSGNVGIGTSAPGYKLEVNGVICGGQNNTVGSTTGAILGGLDNYTYDSATVIVSGRANRLLGKYSIIGGGVNDTISSSQYSMIGGGQLNKLATSNYSFVGGGYVNEVYISENGAIVGGDSNLIDYGVNSIIGCGAVNTARGDYSGILSGRNNYINNFMDYTIIGGGTDNRIQSGSYASILGGRENYISGNNCDYSVIAGGYGDTVQTKYSAVLSGYSNKATAYLYDSATVVCGGYNNSADGAFCTIGGGQNNSVNTTTGGTIPGGRTNSVTGPDGFAANYGSTCAFTNSAVFNGQTATAINQLRCATISKMGGTFTIDHPLDPTNKILNHYFVESPEMVNIYRGQVVIGDNGRAVVHLPDYFSALNKNPMVQLTAVGAPEIVYVAEKVSGNSFEIGGKAGTEVYWTVTGARKDKPAEIIAILMPVEQQKTGDLQGHSLDDDFLATTLDELRRMGRADGYSFRTAEGRAKYERMQEHSNK